MKSLFIVIINTPFIISKEIDRGEMFRFNAIVEYNKEVTEETNTEIVDIVYDLIKNSAEVFKTQDDDIHTYKNQCLQITEDNINQYLFELNEEFVNALKTFIFYDNVSENWRIKYTVEPNYDILNILNKKKTVKLIFVGSGRETSAVYSKNRETMMSIFSRIYHNENIESMYCNISFIIELLSSFEIYRDKNSYTIIFNDMISLSLLSKLTTYENIRIFILSDCRIKEIKMEFGNKMTITNVYV